MSQVPHKGSGDQQVLWALAGLYQITSLPLSDLPWNSCTVAHIYQTNIYHGSDLPNSYLPLLKYNMKKMTN